MQDTQLPNEPTTTNTPTPVKSSSKKALIVIGAVLSALLLTLIVLVIVLLSKSDSTDNSVPQETSSSSKSSEPKSDSGREVLLRAPTSDSKLEYVVYKPVQNGANTTIYFAVENICAGCSGSTSTYMVTSNFDRKSYSFLVDDTNGKKYTLITDEDGEELTTPNCGRSLKFGDRSECFASFTKVPSGSTVSWVFGSARIDNIKVE